MDVNTGVKTGVENTIDDIIYPSNRLDITDIENIKN